MTVEEVVRAALGRLQGTTDGRFMARPVMYERVGRYQQRCFAKAAQEDPDFFGTWADGDLDADYRLDLRDLLDPVPAAGRITKVEILDPGTSYYREGQEVNVVSRSNLAGHQQPRITIRDGLIEGVERGGAQDLEGVASLRVYYPRMTPTLGAGDRDTEIELPEPWDELLVLDLAIHVVRRAPAIDAIERREALNDLGGEFGALYSDFEDHMKRFTARVSVPPAVW